MNDAAGCPYMAKKRRVSNGGGRAEDAKEGSATENGAVYYHSYLQLERILESQDPISRQLGDEKHEEMLFIITHQTYELWFKQILHELDSVLEIFSHEKVHPKDLKTAVCRLERIIEILKLLVSQIGVLLTMSPVQFLEFRDILAPASGFQSVQFRQLETKLGLRPKDRLKYNGKSYCTFLSSDHASTLQTQEGLPSLYDLVEAWLERTPTVTQATPDDCSFWESYRNSVKKMVDLDRASVLQDAMLDDTNRNKAIERIAASQTRYDSLFDEAAYKARQARNEVRMSQAAFKGALVITLYQDEPLLQYPSRLLDCLRRIDEQMTSWRYRHAQMAHTMLGDKIGTGGSSGYRYLQGSASKHKIFTDFHNISTFLIRPDYIPPLPVSLRRLFSLNAEPEQQTVPTATHHK